MSRTRSWVRIFSSTTCSSVHEFRSQFSYLLTKPELSLNQLKWRALLNTLVGSRRRESDLLTKIDVSDIGKLLECISLSPAQARKHVIFSLCGSRVLQLRAVSSPFQACESMTLARAFLEARLDLAGPDTLRFHSRQVIESVDVAGEVIRQLVKDIIVDCMKLTAAQACEAIYVIALSAIRYGISGLRNIDALASDAVNYAMGLAVGESLQVKAEVTWALSVLANHNLVSPQTAIRNKRIVCDGDLVRLRGDIGMSSGCFADLKHLFQIESGLYRNNKDSGIYKTVSEVVSGLSGSGENGSMAAQCIWWCAVADEPSPDHLPAWVRTCMNKRASMTDNERWIASNGLKFLTTRGIKSREIDYCLKHDLINSRSSVSRRR